MAVRGKNIGSLALSAPEELKYLVIVIESFGIKLKDVHIDHKNGIGCMVFDEGNNGFAIGKVRRIVDKYSTENVQLVKVESYWYFSFPESHIVVLGEYLSILKEIS